MVAVWVVVGVLALGLVSVTVAARRHHGDVEPTVREFAEFRDAISRQVTSVESATHRTRTHVDQFGIVPGGSTARSAGREQARG
jgi:hypothetical protein